MIKSSKIFDPLNNKFIPLSSEQGKLIQLYSGVCEKCEPSKIFNQSSKRCIKKTSPIAKQILKKEIEFCNKYDIAAKRQNEKGIKILDEIMDIKIPANVINQKKPLKVKKFLENYGQDPNSLAKLLKIKNVNYVIIVNTLGVLFFGLYKLMAQNPEVYNFLKNKIKQIIDKSGSKQDGVINYLLNILKKIDSRLFIGALASVPLFHFFLILLIL